MQFARHGSIFLTLQLSSLSVALPSVLCASPAERMFIVVRSTSPFVEMGASRATGAFSELPFRIDGLAHVDGAVFLAVGGNIILLRIGARDSLGVKGRYVSFPNLIASIDSREVVWTAPGDRGLEYAIYGADGSRGVVTRRPDSLEVLQFSSIIIVESTMDGSVRRITRKGNRLEAGSIRSLKGAAARRTATTEIEVRTASNARKVKFAHQITGYKLLKGRWLAVLIQTSKHQSLEVVDLLTDQRWQVLDNLRGENETFILDVVPLSVARSVAASAVRICNLLRKEKLTYFGSNTARDGSVSTRTGS